MSYHILKKYNYEGKKMNSRIKKSIILIIAIAFIVISTIIYYFKFNPNIMFWINIFTIILICYKAKFSFISLQTVLINYILLPVFFQYNEGTSYGILEIGKIPLNYSIINYTIVIYNCINLFFIFNTNFLVKEQELLKDNPKIEKGIACFFGTVAIIATLIALPSIPFQTSDIRNVGLKALLPGNAWNHVAIAALIFAFPRLKDSKYVKFSYVFTIFWFLSHFERVDVLGLIIMIILLVIINVNAKLRKKMIIMTGILCVAIFFIMTAIANVRVNKEVTFNSLIRSIFVHSTVSDIAYTYNAAIQYNIEHENLYGKTYKSYLIEAIPLLKSDTDVEKILLDEYATVGGNYLLGEPVINFGIIGVVIFKIVELYIIYNLAKHKYKINYFWYLFLIATIFRSIWYGLSYIELGMLYMVPIFYIIAFKRRAITKYIYQAKAMFQRKE